MELSSHRKYQEKPDTVKAPLFVAAENEKELYERGMEDVMINLEKNIIAHTMEKAGNSKMRAAELLKISFRSLRYKTKKYGLD